VVATGLETGEASMPAYVQALLEQTAENLDTLQRTIANAEERRRSSDSTLVTLAEKISRLTDQMKAEQSLLLKIGENQVALQPTMARLAEGLERGQFGIDEATQQHIRNIEVVLHHLRGDLTEGRSGTVQEIRSEIKLLARTISALAEEAQ
jgi:chromosome segregation ATPase